MTEEIRKPTVHSLASAAKDGAILLLGLTLFMWVLEILHFLPLINLDKFGVKPRELSGLPGVLSAPWLHIGFGHLISNTVPFIVLGGIVLLGGRKVFFNVTLFVSLIGGGLLWLLGPAHTNHLGASITIFGYLGFLLSRGFFERSIFWILVSFGILVLYGYMIFGMLPGQEHVSWQGHLFGFIAGIISAKALFPRNTQLYAHPAKNLPEA